MDLAVREGLNDIVSLLLENGANIATDLQYYNYCLISMMPLTSHYMQNWSYSAKISIAKQNYILYKFRSAPCVIASLIHSLIQIYQSEGGLGLLF